MTTQPTCGSRAVTLDSLLLPGTTDDIKEIYRHLEQQADIFDFGPLEDGVVVLDTETTGLSFKDCELIEIAAAKLKGREIVERFQTFVHPSGPIPAEIQRLTHISELDVIKAPAPEEAVAALASFVGGAPVLAHNAAFDRTFVEKVPGGRDVSDFWVDTLSLSRVALPRLRSHRLSDMAQAFHCESVTHRATDDVDALCGMWRILLCGLKALPDGLLAYLAEMHSDVEWPLRPILSYVASLQEDAPFDLKGIRRQLASQGNTSARRGKTQEVGRYSSPSRDELEEFFCKGGLLSQEYSQYEYRPSQVEMSLEVRDALATGSHRVLEVGTGVGKSIAYLAPEVLFAKRNDLTIGVATKTNALTDQLISHDLPLINKVIPGGITYYGLKGYEHYPCLLRMDQTARQETVGLSGRDGRTSEGAGHETLTALAVAFAFASQSIDGDLDALGIRWKSVPRSCLAVGPSECARTQCPYFPNECFVHGARRRAASADVVVTNHALLLRDIAMDNALLPPISHWVVDEAHGFEEEARRQWSREVSGCEVKDVFALLGNSKGGLLHSLMVQTSVLDDGTLVLALLSKASSWGLRAQDSLAEFFSQLHDLFSVSRDRGEYGVITLWVDEKVRNTNEWSLLEKTAADCVEKIEGLVSTLKDAQEALSEASPRLSAQIEGPLKRLADLRDVLQLVFFDPSDSYVFSAELHKQRKFRGQDKIAAQKVDVGDDLKHWLEDSRSVVFTSATLTVAKSFEHFEHGIGLDRLPDKSFKALSLSSEYDFDNHMAIVVAEDMPQPNERGYLEALSDLLYEVHVSMGGSVLTLFTNRRDMERVYQDVSPRLAAKGLRVACQERGSSPRRLRQQFLSDASTSLFALRSFWEGFDAAGDTLRCVVITKLPFANPNDPLVKERELRDNRSWWKHSLPDAIISVKQAAGRLIRSSQDVGVLVVADSRVAKKRYGKQFLDSLPSQNRTLLGRANVGRFIELWRRSKGR